MPARWNVTARRRRVVLSALMGVVLVVLTVSHARAWGDEPLSPICLPSDSGVDDMCEEWIALYDNPSAHEQQGQDIVVDMALSGEGDRVYLTGASQNHDGNLDFVTVALDAQTGTRLWASVFEGPAGKDDVAFAVETTPDGRNVFVTGTVDATEVCVYFRQGCTVNNTGGDFLTLAYDAVGGTQIWAARHDGPLHGGDIPVDIAASADGTEVYVAGTSTFAEEEIDSESDVAVVAYQAASGQEIWSETTDGGFLGSDRAVGLAASVDGTGLFVAASSSTDLWGDQTDFWTFAIRTSGDPDRLGERLWSKRHGTSDAEAPAGIELSRDGKRLYVAGSRTTGTPRGFVVVSYDASTGDVAWATSASPNGLAMALAVSPDDGRVFVTGYGPQASSQGLVSELVTVAYGASTGNQTWTARYSATASISSRGFDISASPSGNRIYVTGRAVAGSATCATLSYSASSGLQDWVAMYSPVPGVDDADCQIVRASDKRVYVAGVMGSGSELYGGLGSSGNQTDIGVLSYRDDEAGLV